MPDQSSASLGRNHVKKLLSFRWTTYVLTALLAMCFVARLGLQQWYGQRNTVLTQTQTQAQDLSRQSQLLMSSMREAHINFQGYLLSGDHAYMVRLGLNKGDITDGFAQLGKLVAGQHTSAVYQRARQYEQKIMSDVDQALEQFGKGQLSIKQRIERVQQVRNGLDNEERMLVFVHQLELERIDVLSQEIQSIRHWLTVQDNAFMVITFVLLSLMILRLKSVLFDPLREIGSQMEKMDGSLSSELSLKSREPELLSLIARFNDLIARLKARDRELARARENEVATLTQAIREKEEFSSVLAHEIRTPLATLLGMIQLAQDEQRGMQIHEVQGLGRVSRGLMDLVNSTLDYSRLESGQVDLNIAAFRLKQIFQPLNEVMGAMANESKVAIRFESDLDDSKPILADQSKIEQVLLNLLSNGVKFTPEGGQVVLRVSREKGQAGERLKFAVKDTGIGIEESARQMIFEPFKQANSGVKRRYGGTGIGLALCKRLVKAMGGDMVLQSRLGEGSEFSFTIAYREAASANEEGDCLQAKNKPASLSGMNVLLVEDHAMNAKINGKLFEKRGAKITWADTGEKALDLFEESSKFDLVLMDINLGEGLSGLEVTEILHARFGAQCPPVIALTAGVVETQRAAMLASGILAILEKPCDIDKACQLIAELKNKKREKAVVLPLKA